MPIEVCPNETLLHAFATGDLSLRAGDEVAEHLSGCSGCEAIIERCESEASELIGQICAAPWQKAFADEPELKHALMRVSWLDAELMGSVGDGSEPRPRSNHGARPKAGLIEFLGDYEIVGELGAGAMGVVYKARHQRLNRWVALKVMAERRSSDPLASSRFCREMQAIGKLDHPNIVQAGDAGEIDGMLYIAMQFVDGLDLSRVALRVGPLRDCDACEVIRQAAQGLECARRSGIVHRDVKPSNLILDHDGKVRVLDLGLALFDTRHDEAASDLTMEGQLMGTLEYMAPEQLDDSHNVNTRADVYGLGATLYRLLSGQTPLHHDQRRGTPLERLLAIACAEPKPIHECCSDLPPELAAVIDRMLSRDPKQRFSTPGSVAEALQPFTASNDLVALIKRAESCTPSVQEFAAGTMREQTGPTSLPSVSEESIKPSVFSRRRQLIAFAIATIVLCAGVATAVAVFHASGRRIDESIKATAPAGSPEYQVAAWVLSIGGRPTIAPATDLSSPWTPASLSDLPAERFFLTNIEFAGVQLEPGDLQKLAGLRHLNSLRMGHTNLTDDDLADVAGLPITRLELHTTNISDRGIENLGNLPNLQVLVLNDTRVGDAALELISDRATLRELNLAGTAITDKGILHLSKLSNLESLDIEFTDVGDEGAAELAKLKQLRKLKIWKTRISEEWDERLEHALPLLNNE